MQLRRGPPEVRPLDARMTPLRLVKAPMAPRARRGWQRWIPFDGYSVRIRARPAPGCRPPSTIPPGFVMANWSAHTSIAQSKPRAETTADNAAVRINDWVAERKAEIHRVATDQAGDVSSPNLNALLLSALGQLQYFEALQVVDLTGA